MLDRGEYKYHKDLMGYSDKLDTVLKEQLSELIELVRNKELCFDHSVVEKYHEKYKNVKFSKQ